jgi:hypothetical protein
MTIGAESHAEDLRLFRRMPQNCLHSSGMTVPKANGSIVTDSGNDLPIRTEDGSPDGGRMGKGEKKLSCRGGPDARDFVATGADESISIRAEGNGEYPVRVFHRANRNGSSLPVPNPHIAVITPRGNEASIRTETGAPDMI